MNCSGKDDLDEGEYAHPLDGTLTLPKEPT